MPETDLPFEPEVIYYIGQYLRRLGVTPSRSWARDNGGSISDLWVGNFPGAVEPARDAVPKSNESWEASKFFAAAILLSIDFVRQGPITRFAEFELAMVELLGEKSRSWLPSLFLAASACPCIDAERRVSLVEKFDPERLLVEQEAADRLLSRDE